MTFANGDEVRINKTGRQVILTDINPNPDYVEDDETWAEAEDDYGDSHYIDSPDDVTLIRKAADIPAKTLPTVKEVGDVVSSGILQASGFGSDELRFDQVDKESDSVYLAYGISSTGAKFAVYVEIGDPGWVD